MFQRGLWWNSLIMIHPETGNTLTVTGILKNLKNPTGKKPRSSPCQAAHMTNRCLNFCLLSSDGTCGTGPLPGCTESPGHPTPTKGEQFVCSLFQSHLEQISCGLDIVQLGNPKYRPETRPHHTFWPWAWAPSWTDPETSWNQCPP